MEWIFPEDVTVSPALREVVGGHPLVAEILARRGVTTPEAAKAFLDPKYYTPSPPTALPDVDVAAQRLHEAVKRNERILVWGDFDVDGQTSTALLVDALRFLYSELQEDAILSEQVHFHVPHRQREGHGVHTDILVKKIRDLKIDVVLTCDVGIAAHDAAQAAHVNGVDMLITDHHALPPTLPNAPALVNPQRLPAGHALRDLPGVGVAFKLIQQLYTLAGFEEDTELFLDLVALGIVADVARQQHDTRYLLQLGIEALRRPERIGLQALMKSAQVDVSNLSSETIGFQIGPRLNALGRLDDASLAVDLLTTANMLHASQIAAQLEVLNNKRKQIENQIYAAAQDQIARDSSLLHNYDIILLSGDHWHPGVIGIVASRLVEQYGKPALLLQTPPDQPARGSARSVPGVDIGACIAATSHLLMGHGGHPGAAGVTLDADMIPQFRQQLSNLIAETRDPNVKVGHHIDAEVPLDILNLDLATDLNRIGPFGAGNPPVHLLTRGVRMVQHASFGVNGKHRRVTIQNEEGLTFAVTWWRGDEFPLPPADEAFDLLYTLRINDYKERHSLQLEWIDTRYEGSSLTVGGPRYHIEDLRRLPLKLGFLNGESSLIWAENLDAASLPFPDEQIATRSKLGQTSALVIYTIPPAPEVLAQALNKTRANTLVVAAKHIPTDTPESFLNRLGGLVKYALAHYEGKVSIETLASETAQRELTVRRGLAWMAAKGMIALDFPDGAMVQISQPGSPLPEEDIAALQDAIAALLAESAAYRSYFLDADLERVLRL
ncbi:MAG: single-stranded-DNA-specific exonuclease RecJ [Chloroflexi bacterium]|nr:single-stranded-DNA-specific exonuclease RecJ [Chloroflexota bacterium]